jgi:hypothetical protein
MDVFVSLCSPSLEIEDANWGKILGGYSENRSKIGMSKKSNSDDGNSV